MLRLHLSIEIGAGTLQSKDTRKTPIIVSNRPTHNPGRTAPHHLLLVSRPQKDKATGRSEGLAGSTAGPRAPSPRRLPARA